MLWSSLGVRVIIGSTGAFIWLEGGSKPRKYRAIKVALTTPGNIGPTGVARQWSCSVT